MVRPLDGPTVAPLPNDVAAAQPVESAAYAGGAESVPTISSVIASGVSIPDLHLDIHVYSAQPAERFIFVNMRKYHEGQTLNEGPVIDRITPEGAILNYQGRRFLLPRQ
jgi:general secretion pathway protein B